MAPAGFLQIFWAEGSPRLRDSVRKDTGDPAPVFQHHFPTSAADILCMAGESAPKPDREQPYGVYPYAVLLFPLEYNADIGIIGLMPTFFNTDMFIKAELLLIFL